MIRGSRKPLSCRVVGREAIFGWEAKVYTLVAV
jgi:hypothetical protein